MSPGRFKLGIGILAAALFIWLASALLFPPTSTQLVEATFARIQTAFHEGDPQDLLANTHIDYSFEGLPRSVSELTASQSDDKQTVRRQILRRLTQYFLYTGTQGTEHAFTYAVDEVIDHDGGSIEALVTIGLTARKGRLPFTIDPPRERHRFWLATEGWLFPQATITKHDPIRL